MKKRFISTCLCLLLAAVSVPAAAYAQDAESIQEAQSSYYNDLEDTKRAYSDITDSNDLNITEEQKFPYEAEIKDVKELIEAGAGDLIIEESESEGRLLDGVPSEHRASCYSMLKEFLYDYGYANNNGGRSVSRNYYLDDGTKFTYGIAYSPSEALFSFILLSDDPEYGVTMEVSENAFGSARATFLSVDLLLLAEASFSAGNYDPDRGVYFRQDDAYYFTDAEIQDVCNASLKAGFSSWEVLLADYLGMTMGDLGFTGYSDPALLHQHDLTKVNKKSATCTKNGNIAYWSCSGCGKCFSDVNGVNEISQKDTVIKSTGHDFSDNAKYCRNECGTKNPDYKADISSWHVEGIENLVYTGKPLVQDGIYVYSDEGEYADFTVKYKDNVSAGKATVIITGKGGYSGTVTKTFRILKAKNTFSNITTKKKLSAAALKTKKQTFDIKASVKEKARKTYTLTSVPAKAKKYISVSGNGRVTVKKGLGKGTYTIKVRIAAAETANYQKSGKTVSVKITVQ